MLTAEGKTTKNKQENLELLQAVWEPTKVAIIPCPGHQKGTGHIQTGNNLADQTARGVVSTLKVTPVLVDPGARSLPWTPQYIPADLAWIRTLPMARIVEDWWRTADRQVILPREMGLAILRKIHQSSHLGI